mmetsp:Transcript_1006/g.1143  ORF Transcript_1006/g.1143 Transcript_1006/m.1143 type:complete len:377 (-) Transcript_1006:195-1325(-)
MFSFGGGASSTAKKAFPDLIRPHKVSLCSLPSQLAPLDNVSKSLKEKLYIKRDDNVGASAADGCTVRKLEFIMHEAKTKQATVIITYGDSPDSDWCRTCAITARQMNMDCYLFLRGEKPSGVPKPNLFLMEMCGAAIEYLDKSQYTRIAQRVDSLCTRLLRKGEIPYFIPEGGSTPAGLWGYVDLVRELVDLSKIKPTHVIVPVDTGTSLAGILIGRQVFNCKHLKVVGVSIKHTEQQVRHAIQRLHKDFNKAYGTNYHAGHYVLLDRYRDESYRPDINRAMRHLAQAEGIVLDPALSAPAYFAFREQLLNGALSINTNTKIVFVHTGCVISLLTQRSLLTKDQTTEDDPRLQNFISTDFNDGLLEVEADDDVSTN